MKMVRAAKSSLSF